ncbi:MAG: hypothetical protein Q8O46_02285 [bacterium]|nr:hypothetical protein [bacterium]
MDYIIESLDERPGWHKVKTIRNIIKIETTHRHFVLTTLKNKTLKLRTDTWKAPKPTQSDKGWHEPADHTGKAPLHKIAATRNKVDNVLRKSMEQSDQTDKFKKDFTQYLTQLKKNNRNDTTISEFQRWLQEDLIPFKEKSPHEQIDEKIYYEIDIGNNSIILDNINTFFNIWIQKNVGETRDNQIYYHGTTEDKYRKIITDGMIKTSTTATVQHSGFEHDIGTISLAKMKGAAHFFSAISGKGKQNQIVLHIDIRKLDPAAITKRKLINTPDGELLYRKNIPVSAILKAETVYTTKSR